MIRKAKVKDRTALADMTREIYGQYMANHGIDIIEEDLYKLADLFIKNDRVLVVEQDGQVCGMCAWMIVPHFLNNNVKIWQELCWCLKSKYRTDALLLLRAMEADFKASGANMMVLANLSIENEPMLKRIYEKRGYIFMESHFAKRRNVNELLG